MDKKQYRELIPLVNDPEYYPLLKQYAEERISFFHRQLATEGSLDRIRSHQGTIAELKKLLSLRDEVLEKAK